MTRPLKPWMAIEDQIARLRSRGMEVEDPTAAAHALASIGYYRLSGYWYPYRTPDPNGSARRLSQFSIDTRFSEVTELYHFDRNLRSLVLSGIEQIEVALRSQIGHLLGQRDALSHTDASTFRPSFNHAKWWSTAQGRISRARGRDETVKHHDEHYGSDIPIWVLTDLLDFSDLSRLYSGMRSGDQKSIAEWFGVAALADASKSARIRWAKNPPLTNWLEHLTVVRNICAHHGRLWNRQLTPLGTSQRIRHLTVFDELPSALAGAPGNTQQSERVFGTVCVVSFLLHRVDPGNNWRTQINTLVNTDFPKGRHRSISEMEFPEHLS